MLARHGFYYCALKLLAPLYNYTIQGKLEPGSVRGEFLVSLNEVVKTTGLR